MQRDPLIIHRAAVFRRTLETEDREKVLAAAARLHEAHVARRDRMALERAAQVQARRADATTAVAS